MRNNAQVKNPPAVAVVAPAGEAPVRKIDANQLAQLGQQLTATFDRYANERWIAESRWLMSLRQYLGIYDPEIEQIMDKKRSRAYPRVTRVKVISMLSRVMNLMFPGTEKNWKLGASPNADMTEDDVKEAITALQKKFEDSGGIPPSTDMNELVQTAVNELAQKRAAALERWIDDQLQEIGGDQTLDYIALNRAVLKSGIMYGAGLLRGPYLRTDKRVQWTYANGGPVATETDNRKPMFEFLPIWDFYPDMSAKTFKQMDGYFIRTVMSRAQLRDLARRPDFFGDVIKSYLNTNTQGNYKARNFETLLKSLGNRSETSDQIRSEGGGRYEIISWHGPVSGQYLQYAGVDVDADKLADDFEAEVWMVEGKVIKCEINAWTKLNMKVDTIHAFVFDEDDTSPIGNGLPMIVRDSQMSICAATRMLLDNASVVCGPQLEVNTSLLRIDQDITSIEAYKLWYRDDDGLTAQYPAVRRIEVEGHLNELQGLIELFSNFADQETFVGPQTGGDREGPKSSEPMRSAVGAGLMRADAALPFKDIVRNFDFFTQSVISSLVSFNIAFNPDKALAGDYNVVARGATSLIAKEIRGQQIDQLTATLTDEEKLEIDPRKLARARFESRDLTDILLSDSEAQVNRQRRDQASAQAQQQQREVIEAEIRQTLSAAFKNISQGQKNSASADATTVEAVLKLLEQGLNDATVPADRTAQNAKVLKGMTSATDQARSGA